jgi:hypothetical protein
MLDPGFWILNAERALVSLEKSGAALNGIAGGNRRVASRFIFVFHPTFKIKNSKSACL